MDRSPGLRVEELPELLGNLSEAPSFAAGAAMLLEQLADAAGAPRGLLLTLDRHGRVLSERVAIARTASENILALAKISGASNR